MTDWIRHRSKRSTVGLSKAVCWLSSLLFVGINVLAVGVIASDLLAETATLDPAAAGKIMVIAGLELCLLFSCIPAFLFSTDKEFAHTIPLLPISVVIKLLTQPLAIPSFLASGWNLVGLATGIAVAMNYWAIWCLMVRVSPWYVAFGISATALCVWALVWYDSSVDSVHSEWAGRLLGLGTPKRGRPTADAPQLLHPAQIAWAGTPDALDELASRRRPVDISVLVESLDHDDKRIAMKSAWLLAELLNDPSVRDQLETTVFRFRFPVSPRFQALLYPFGVKVGSNLAQIAGRIFELLKDCADDEIPNRRLNMDPRIAVPLPDPFSNERCQIY